MVSYEYHHCYQHETQNCIASHFTLAKKRKKYSQLHKKVTFYLRILKYRLQKYRLQNNVNKITNILFVEIRP